MEQQHETSGVLTDCLMRRTAALCSSISTLNSVYCAPSERTDKTRAWTVPDTDRSAKQCLRHCRGLPLRNIACCLVLQAAFQNHPPLPQKSHSLLDRPAHALWSQSPTHYSRTYIALGPSSPNTCPAECCDGDSAWSCPLPQKPQWGPGRPSAEISRSHTQTRYEWSAHRTGRYLHNTQQREDTNIRAVRGIRTRDPNNRPNAEIRLRTHGHRDRKLGTKIVTYLLTPWSRVLLEKLTGSAASQEIPRIFGTWRFLTVFTSARHLSLSWANSIQSPKPLPLPEDPS